MTDHRFVSTLDGWDPRTLTFLDYTGPMMWRHTCSTAVSPTVWDHVKTGLLPDD